MNSTVKVSVRPILIAILLGAAGLGFAQSRSRQEFDPQTGLPGNLVRLEGGLVVNEDELHTARETATHSAGTPNWTNASGFERDVFVFTRIIFKSEPGLRSGRGQLRWLGWWVDYPDADLNLSYRLQQMTSLKTDPDARVLRLTDPKLSDYPLLYMEHAGYMHLSDEETVNLRKYLLSGGALFVNDFWGSEEWEGFAREIKKVLPDHSWTNLTMDHEVFHCVYDLGRSMKKLQVPTMQFWNRDYDPDNPRSRQQTIFRGEGSEEVHIRALFDDRRRMMILAIHNSDVSDGWEREQENEVYFNQYSERVAYPLGINIIFYLMTH
jgi:hypothetical protein